MLEPESPVVPTPGIIPAPLSAASARLMEGTSERERRQRNASASCGALTTTLQLNRKKPRQRRRASTPYLSNES